MEDLVGFVVSCLLIWMRKRRRRPVMVPVVLELAPRFLLIPVKRQNEYTVRYLSDNLSTAMIAALVRADKSAPM